MHKKKESLPGRSILGKSSELIYVYGFFSVPNNITLPNIDAATYKVLCRCLGMQLQFAVL